MKTLLFSLTLAALAAALLAPAAAAHDLPAFSMGFENTPCETHRKIASLNVTGKFPEWLSGALIRNGPSNFPNYTNSHWFLGLAMLRGFYLDGEKQTVSYVDKFTHSASYNATCGLPVIASDAANTGVTIRRVGGHYLSNTAYSKSNEFDVHTLADISLPFKYTDGEDTFSPAPSHAQIDPEGNLFHLMYELEGGPTERGYRFYSIEAGSTSRNIGPLVPANPAVTYPLYSHSFSLTENYIILIETPCAMAANGNFRDYQWIPELPVTWRLMDRKTLKQVRHFTTSPAFFQMHTINAYEDGDEIVVDLITYPDTQVLDALYLNMLINQTAKAAPIIATARPFRFRLPLSQPDGTNVEGKMIADATLELPTIHYDALNTQKYTYLYAMSIHDTGAPDFYNQLTKLNVDSGDIVTWYAEGTFPGEPIFVPSPQKSNNGGVTRAEDEGVVLSLVLDSTNKVSFLLVLDAQSFKELARIHLPFTVDFGFHGRWYDLD